MSVSQFTLDVQGRLDATQIRADLLKLSKTANIKVGVDSKTQSGIKNTSTSMAGISTNAKKATTNVGGLNSKLKSSVGHFGQIIQKVALFSLATGALTAVTAGVGNMVKQVYDLDTSLTELKKVSDLQGQSLKNFTDEAYKAGEGVAKTGREMIDASTVFKRSGFTDKEALQLATTASMFQNIADTEITAGDSASFIISQMKAFNIEATNAQSIIDKVNGVSNRFAVGTNDLQTALTKTGSALGSLGNTYDETIGLVTAGTEVLVKQPGKVGKGLRTIGLNISKLSTTTGELTYKVGDSTKTLKLMDEATGETASTFDVFKSVSKNWDKMTDAQKQSLGIALAGKTQYEVFASVMGNFDTALDATETSLNSQGSAVAENEKRLDSLKGKVNLLRSAWEEFAYKTINSEWIGNVLDMATKALRFFSSDEGQTALKTILQIGGAFLVFKGLGSITKSIGGFNTALMGSTVAGKEFMGIIPLLASNPAVTGMILLAGALVAVGVAYKESTNYAKKYKEKQDEIIESKEKIDSISAQIKALEGSDSLTKAQKKKLDDLKEEYALEKKIYDLKLSEAKVDLQKMLDADKKETTDKIYGIENPGERTDVTGTFSERKKETFNLYKDEAKNLNTKALKNRIEGNDETANAETEQALEAQKKADAELQAVIDRMREINQQKDENGDRPAEFADEYETLSKTRQDIEDSRDYLYNLSDDIKTAMAKNKDIFESNDGKLFMSAQALKAFGDENNLTQEEIENLGQQVEDAGGKVGKFTNDDLKNMADGTEKLATSLGGVGKENEIDFSTFVNASKEVGTSTEDIIANIKAMKEENPELKFTSMGKEQTMDDIIAILNGTKKLPKEKTVKVKANTAKAKSQITDVNSKVNGLPSLKTISVKSITSTAIQAFKNVKEAIDSVPKAVTIVTHFVGEKLFGKSKKKAKGTQNAQAGLHMVNDEVNAPNGDPTELIESKGKFFMMNGKNALVNLNNGDKVYTAKQTQEMLNNQKVDVPNHARGTHNISFGSRKSSKETSSKYESLSATLNQKNSLGLLSPKAFISKLKDLTTKYKTSIDDWRSYQTQYYGYINNLAQEHFDDIIGKLSTESGYTRKGVDNAIATVKRLYKQHKISYEDELDMLNQVYTAKTDAEMQRVEDNEKSYKTMQKFLKKYYKAGKISATQYYEYLDELEEKNLENLKEKKQAEIDTNTAQISLAKMAVEQHQAKIDDQIEALQDEKDALNDVNDAIEESIKLQKLESALAEAKEKKNMVYVEGQGFVAQTDEVAVADAQSDLDSYNRELARNKASDALDDQIEALQDARDSWDDYISTIEDVMEQQDLEKDAGKTMAETMEMFAIRGLAVTDDFKTAFSKALQEAQDLQNAMKDLENGTTITVSKAKTKSKAKKKSTKKKYAKGTTSAEGGLSMVGEQGAELRVLNSGDGILPANISKNLMELGRYSVPELRSLSSSGTTSNININFGEKSIVVNGDDGNNLAQDIVKNARRIIIQETNKR